jgi:hypothetical protein
MTQRIEFYGNRFFISILIVKICESSSTRAIIVIIIVVVCSEGEKHDAIARGGGIKINIFWKFETRNIDILHHLTALL